MSQQAPSPNPAEPMFAFTPAITPKEAAVMTSLQLSVAIGEKYPQLSEGECVAYLEGGARAATMLGLTPIMCNGFMSEWSRFDEKLYVGSLYVLVRQKATAFAGSIGAAPSPIIIQ